MSSFKYENEYGSSFDLPENKEFDAWLNRGKKTLYKNLKGEYYWTIANGKEILIKDMETSHILNCIKMLQNKPNWEDINLEIVRILEREVRRRQTRIRNIFEEK